jgi:hypothetical protein
MRLSVAWGLALAVCLRGALCVAPGVTGVSPSRLSTVTPAPLTVQGTGFVNGSGLAVRLAWGAHAAGGATCVWLLRAALACPHAFYYYHFYLKNYSAFRF